MHKKIFSILGATLILIIATQLELPVKSTSFCNLLIAATTFIAIKLNKKEIVIVFSIYFILGLLGAPIYHPFQAEHSFIFGPWGGFIAGYFIATLLVKFFKSRFLFFPILIFFISHSLGLLWIIDMAGLIILQNSGIYWTLLFNAIQVIIVTIILHNIYNAKRAKQ